MPDNHPYPYYQTKEILVHLNGHPVRAFSRAGLPGGSDSSPAEILLAKEIHSQPDASLFLWGCGDGALSAYLASQLPQGRFWFTDASALAVNLTRLSLLANGIENAQARSAAGLLPESRSSFDTAVILMPKGRKLARRWLVEAYESLRPGGQCYVAGANQEGIQAVLKDAGELLGGEAVLGYKKGSRVARFARPRTGAPLPDWASEPGIAPGTWSEFDASLGAVYLHLRSLPGVFSQDGLDPGTRLLLENMPPTAGKRVLDVGCGCGVIGLFAARMGAAAVDLCDVNLLAVTCAAENARLNHISNAQVYASDVLESVSANQYELILSNPPFHNRKEVDYQVTETLIQQAYQALGKGGRLVIVANRFIKYDRMISQVFETARVLAENRQYWVLEGEK